MRKGSEMGDEVREVGVGTSRCTDFLGLCKQCKVLTLSEIGGSGGFEQWSTMV